MRTKEDLREGKPQEEILHIDQMGQAEEGKVRETILEEDHLAEAVVGMDEDLQIHLDQEDLQEIVEISQGEVQAQIEEHLKVHHLEEIKEEKETKEEMTRPIKNVTVLEEINTLDYNNF